MEMLTEESFLRALRAVYVMPPSTGEVVLQSPWQRATKKRHGKWHWLVAQDRRVRREERHQRDAAKSCA